MMTLLFLTEWGRKNIIKTIVIGLVFDITLAYQTSKFLKCLLTTSI
jgi:hypothetical protein